MLIVLSPAKTLDYSFSEKKLDFSVPHFLPKSKNLISTMKKLNKSELSSLMGVSDKISALNHDRFQNWSQATKPSAQAKQAGLVFKGDVYQGLEFEKLSKQDINFAQKHLRILSWLYGVLKPLDIISKKSFENAMVLITALGGSTNAVLHLLAIAHTAKINFALDDFQRISDSTPYLADLKPSGKYLMEDLHKIGGTSGVIKYLIKENLMCIFKKYSLTTSLTYHAVF